MSLFRFEEGSGYSRMGKPEQIERRRESYMCPECGFSYHGSRAYAYHLVMQHKLKPEDFTDGYGHRYFAQD